MSAPKWVWSRQPQRWEMEFPGTLIDLRVRFFKIGGRHSGVNNGRSFWKVQIQNEYPDELWMSAEKYATADEAKAAAEAAFRERYPTKAHLLPTRSA